MPILFSNPVFLRKTTNCIRKCWPGIQRIGSDANSSEYRTPEDLKDLNVKFDPNVVSYINMDSVRLQFAMIKRHLLSRDSLDDIATHVKAHKKFVLEFYMTTKGAQPEVVSFNVQCCICSAIFGSFAYLLGFLDNIMFF